jgi:(R,R)-butanediol dehydrogenase / meso-butanediol dehydrogenase / diacetyl reductase
LRHPRKMGETISVSFALHVSIDHGSTRIMKLANIYGPNDVRVDEVATPKAGARDVIVKVSACGVCGTDLTFIKLGGTGVPGFGASPMPLGHEAAGVVAEVGAEVVGVVPGMRVIVNPMGTPHIIGNGGAEGAFTNYLLVRDAVLDRGLWEVPSGMPLHVAALTEPMAVGRHGVNRANPTPDSRCVVFGVGPIGLGAITWLSRRGVRSIVAVDVSRERLVAAKRLGATQTLVVGECDLFDALTALHGAATSVMGPAVGSDIFFDFAGVPQVVVDVLNLAKQGATLLMVAIHPTPEPIDFNKLVVKEISLLGSCGYPQEYPEVIADLAAMGKDAEQLISHRFSFDRFHEALETARSGSSTKVMIEFA